MSLQPTRSAVRELDAAHGLASSSTTLDEALKAALSAVFADVDEAAAALNLPLSVVDRYVNGTPRKGDVQAVQLMLRSYAGAVWTPDEANAIGLWSRPGYAKTDDDGTWTASLGDDLTNTGSAPAASSGAPLFATSHVMTADDWYPDPYAGALRGPNIEAYVGASHHMFAVVRLDDVKSNLTDPNFRWCNEGIGDSLACLGIHFVKTGGRFYADYYEWGSSPVYASIDLGATLPSGVLVIEGKYSGGHVWSRRDAGTWVDGGAGVALTAMDGNELWVGPGMNGSVLALGLYTAAKADTFGTMLRLHALELAAS